MLKITKIIIVFLLIFLNIFFIYYYFSIRPESFEIAFIDVGQGHSTIIKTENNKQIIIDSGNTVDGLSNIFSYLGFFNRYFDLVFITHFDIDHADLFPFLIKNFKITEIFEPSVYNKNSLRDEIILILNQKNKELKRVSAGDIFHIDDNTYIKILFPDKFFLNNQLTDNENSLVLKINHKNQSILITGDLPRKFEKYLIKKYGSYLKSDILLAGHHGSNTSSSEEFLRVVEPRYIIISVGKDNSFNLPSPKVLERIKKLEIPILRTDEIGTIIFKYNERLNKFTLK
ncbi:MAG: MBL fold metallo-hydrolase [Candidatus Pacebacteria bacterium]|nr:MBL fold metallo-hydrolase [Candidatus Paceibacterota bacterium]